MRKNENQLVNLGCVQISNWIIWPGQATEIPAPGLGETLYRPGVHQIPRGSICTLNVETFGYHQF